MPSNKVLIIVGDATETLDTMYPYYRLIEAGFQPVVAAPEKRKYQMVLHEVKPGWTITKEWEGYTIDADVAFTEIEEEEYAGIFFSGGRAPEYIRYDEDLMRVTKYFFAQNMPVASVCRGLARPGRALRHALPHQRVDSRADAWQADADIDANLGPDHRAFVVSYRL